MNERIVFTNPDGSCGVLIPTGETSIEAVVEYDVPRLVVNDIVFPDNSKIVTGTLVLMKNILHEAAKQKLTVDDVSLMIANMLKQLPNRQIIVAELPVDRMFRDAWDDSNPEDFIGLNAVKAIEIAHNIRRADRDTKMQPLDEENSFVSTASSRKDEIITEKQNILANNSLIQAAIDATIDASEVLDEAALRIVLSDVGIY